MILLNQEIIHSDSLLLEQDKVMDGNDKEDAMDIDPDEGGDVEKDTEISLEKERMEKEEKEMEKRDEGEEEKKKKKREKRVEEEKKKRYEKKKKREKEQEEKEKKKRNEEGEQEDEEEEQEEEEDEQENEEEKQEKQEERERKDKGKGRETDVDMGSFDSNLATGLQTAFESNEPVVEEVEEEEEEEQEKKEEKKKKHKQTDVDMDLDPFMSNKPTTSRKPYVDLKLSGRQIEAKKIMVPNHTSAYGVKSSDLIPLVSAFMGLTEIQRSGLMSMSDVDLMDHLRKGVPKKMKEVEASLSPDQKCLRHSSHPPKSSCHGSTDELSLSGSDALKDNSSVEP